MLNTKSIFFFDLDGTLIDTASGTTFPSFIGDIRFKMPVLDALEEAVKNRDVEYPFHIYIVSNQAGIQYGYVKENAIQAKLEFVRAAIADYIGLSRSTGVNISGLATYYKDPDQASYIEIAYAYAATQTSPEYKPGTQMLEDLVSFEHLHYIANKIDMIMIGDASGLPGNHSDSDKKCAENFGIDYMDVNEFIKAQWS